MSATAETTAPAETETEPAKKSNYKPKANSTDPIDKAIGNAQVLLEAKRKLQADLQSARDFLNSAIGANAVSDDQKAWISDHLAKTKRTRKAK